MALQINKTALPSRRTNNRRHRSTIMNITLTEQEVKAILNELSEIPFKYSSGLIGFLSNKLSEEKKDIEKQRETDNS